MRTNDPLSKIFDRQAALRQMGGDVDLLRDLSALFLAEYPAMLRDIEAAVQSSDLEARKRACHKLRSGLVNFYGSESIAALDALDQESIASEVAQRLTALVESLSRLAARLSEFSATGQRAEACESDG